MISFAQNPRFVRKASARDSEWGLNIFIQYIPAGFWADMVTLTIEFQKARELEDNGTRNVDVVNGYWLKYDISCGSGGTDSKSGISKLEAMDCLAAALSDATQMVRDVQLMFLKGMPLVEIGQAVWEIELPKTSQRNQISAFQKEVPLTRLPNDIFMCDGLLWAEKHDAEAYVKTLNADACVVETPLTQREQDYWWYILKHARAKVHRHSDVSTLLAV